MRNSYVFRGGQFVSKDDGTPMHKPFEGEVCTPQVIHDIEGYQSPQTGKWIGGRESQRQEMSAIGHVPWEPVNPKQYNDARERFDEKKRKKELDGAT